MKRRICAVFDIDDTLYLERDYVQSGFEAVGRWVGNWVGAKDFADRCWQRFLAGDRKSIFDEALRECGTEPADELISGLVEIYRTHEPSISLAEDASEALKIIASKVSIAVVSDGPVISQSRKVDALGLGVFATPIVLTGMFGRRYRKPHPRAFELVAKCRPAEVYVYVADNPLKDFDAPKQLGWVTVRVRRPGGLHYAAVDEEIAPDYEIGDCSRLPEMLVQL
jgi:putative hydrolase of the HAD superfamily